jgi:hypothetical protein
MVMRTLILLRSRRYLSIIGDRCHRGGRELRLRFGVREIKWRISKGSTGSKGRKGSLWGCRGRRLGDGRSGR